MKTLAPFIFAIFLVGAGSVVGWEARNWHIVITEWYTKAAAYDFVGDSIMQQAMYEIAKQRLIEERKAEMHRIKAADPNHKDPSCPPLKPGQVCT